MCSLVPPGGISDVSAFVPLLLRTAVICCVTQVVYNLTFFLSYYRQRFGNDFGTVLCVNA